MALDFDATLVAIVSQPFWLSWTTVEGNSQTDGSAPFCETLVSRLVVRSVQLGRAVDVLCRGPYGPTAGMRQRLTDPTVRTRI